MSFNIFPEKEIDVNELPNSFNKGAIISLLKEFSIDKPISLDLTKPNVVKVSRCLQNVIELNEIRHKFPDLNLKFGNGSRGNSRNKQ